MNESQDSASIAAILAIRKEIVYYLRSNNHLNTGAGQSKGATRISLRGICSLRNPSIRQVKLKVTMKIQPKRKLIRTGIRLQRQKDREEMVTQAVRKMQMEENSNNVQGEGTPPSNESLLPSTTHKVDVRTQARQWEERATSTQGNIQRETPENPFSSGQKGGDNGKASKEKVLRSQQNRVGEHTREDQAPKESQNTGSKLPRQEKLGTGTREKVKMGQKEPSILGKRPAVASSPQPKKLSSRRACKVFD
uniref:Uncharacterized protein n=1 Tax=Leersia perrieri TaxID=77586 RepID=A0A0D9WNC9_9ORYZ